jgi:hypothetical protein
MPDGIEVFGLWDVKFLFVIPNPAYVILNLIQNLYGASLFRDLMRC